MAKPDGQTIGTWGSRNTSWYVGPWRSSGREYWDTAKGGTIPWKAKEYQRSCRFEGFPQDTESPFFHDLCLEFPSTPDALLQSISNDTFRPINVMLWSQFCGGKSEKMKTTRTLARPISRESTINFVTSWFAARYCSLAVQSPLIAALLAYIDRLFYYSIMV